jgi:hypothetical protein
MSHRGKRSSLVAKIVKGTKKVVFVELNPELISRNEFFDNSDSEALILAPRHLTRQCSAERHSSYHT